MQPQTILLLIAAAGLFSVCLVYRQVINLPSLLLVGFFFASPWSAAYLLGGDIQAKWGRAGFALLGIVVLLVEIQRFRMNATTLSVVVASFFYALSALWSEQPLEGFIYKLQFVGCLCLGLLVPLLAADDGKRFKRALIILCVGGAASTMLVYSDILLSFGSAFSHHGRLSAWGMNPNRIGQTWAATALIGLAAILLMKDKTVRLAGLVCIAASLPVVLGTLSRASLMMMIIAAAVMIVPQLASPRQAISLLFVAAVISLPLAYSGDTLVRGDTERLIGAEASREHIWRDGIAIFSERPILGQGWASGSVYGGAIESSAQFHNAGISVMVDAGAIGLSLFLLAAAITWFQIAQTRATAGGVANHQTLYVGLGLTLGTFAHGMVESAIMFGVTPVTVVFGLGLGFLAVYVNQGRAASAYAPVGVMRGAA
ncbi:MAG: O-antigen ligase family protein [Planctomycetota bacterium]